MHSSAYVTEPEYTESRIDFEAIIQAQQADNLQEVRNQIQQQAIEIAKE